VIADAPPPAIVVGVGVREWSVTTYRASVRPGRVRFRVTNFGQDAHDLAVVGPRGHRGRPSPEVPAFGGRRTLEVTLRRPGRYRLLCTLPGHAARGMRATLRVSRRRAA
jgi:plastocyanin